MVSRRARGALGAVVAATTALAVVPPALAHRERPTAFPDPARGAVPEYRTSGARLVVCKQDSRARIARLTGASRTRNLRLLRECRFRHVQQAVNAASNGTRILVLPGVYREEPSRAAPSDDARCASMQVRLPGGVGTVPSYAYQRGCPNAQNLIAIVGDADGDGDCDDKCRLQIEGTGSRPSDVVLFGDRAKLNVVRADRADGIYLGNFTVQYSDFNNVYVIETNGFRLDRIVSRWSREYGFLTFASDHGLYENIVAYGSGDAGVYPGGAPDGNCRRHSIEMRNVNSYGNVFGLSGNAGNSLWVHDSRFHDNVAGILIGSLDIGHPGQPQDCARFERNHIYSNNRDAYSASRDAYCRRPKLERNPRLLCPSTPAPIGTGMIIAGGNDNLVRANWFYDNWRVGALLTWIPALAWGIAPPADQYVTSHGNRFLSNRMGMRPNGARARNGSDFQWDGEGSRNCWSGNRASRGAGVVSRPRALPTCPGSGVFSPGHSSYVTESIACSHWNPFTNPDPAGCSWLVRPPRPRQR